MLTIPGLTVLAMTASLVAAPAVSAQKSASHPVGDTLHFALSSKVNVDMDAGAAGPMNALTTSDMRIALLFGKGDTITVWVESAANHMTSPAGDQDVDVSTMVNKPIIMTLSPDGIFKTVKAANLLGDDKTGMSAMMPDDESFGLDFKHPAGGLRKGQVWTDTTDKKAKPDAPQKLSSHAITRYSVTGDSIVAGRPVIVVEGTTVADVTMDMSIADGQMSMQSKSKTTGVSRIYYSPDLKIILMNTTTGTGEGTQTIEGPMSMTMTTKQKMETTMKPVK